VEDRLCVRWRVLRGRAEDRDDAPGNDGVVWARAARGSDLDPAALISSLFLLVTKQWWNTEQLQLFRD